MRTTWRPARWLGTLAGVALIVAATGVAADAQQRVPATLAVQTTASTPVRTADLSGTDRSEVTVQPVRYGGGWGYGSRAGYRYGAGLGYRGGWYSGYRPSYYYAPRTYSYYPYATPYYSNYYYGPRVVYGYRGPAYYYGW